MTCYYLSVMEKSVAVLRILLCEIHACTSFTSEQQQNPTIDRMLLTTARITLVVCLGTQKWAGNCFRLFMMSLDIEAGLSPHPL